MKILILSNFGMGLYKFRKELIETLRVNDFDVHLAIPVDAYTEKLKALGAHIHEVNLDRRGKNPFKDLLLLRSYLSIIKKVRPEIVLTYTIKPNIYGGLACRLKKIPYIVNITGLGTALEKQSLSALLIKRFYNSIIKKAHFVFFQNEANKTFFDEISVPSTVLPGSGVNLNDYTLREFPLHQTEINLLFIGRLMKSKGIYELLDVAERLENSDIKFSVVGFMDSKDTQIKTKMLRLSNVEFKGEIDEIREVISQSQALVLPSYHEGLSNVLLEAAACGRPVLASNIPGCQETFIEGISGFGFEPKNADSLYHVILKFKALSPNEREKMGIEGRKFVEKMFNRSDIINDYLNVLKSIERGT